MMVEMDKKGIPIVCVQCDETFIFSEADRKRFRDHGFDMPRRCPECRRKKTRVMQGKDDWKRRRRRKEDLFWIEEDRMAGL